MFLVSRVIGLLEEDVPNTWVLSVRKDKTPAVWEQLRDNKDVLVGDLMRSTRNHLVNLPCIPLLLQRKRKLHLLPDEGMPLKVRRSNSILWTRPRAQPHEFNLYHPTKTLFQPNRRRAL